MRVLVIGYGYVGKALVNSFDADTERWIVDPVETGLQLSDVPLSLIDMAFLCLPTPEDTDGSCDTKTVENVLNELPRDLLTVIKSTIPPDKISELSQDRRVVYNPEFLTQRYAMENFLNPVFILLGGQRKDCEMVEYFYSTYTKIIIGFDTVYMVDSMVASFIKYALNCFFATKVVFFNELYQAFFYLQEQHPNLKTTWEDVRKLLDADGRVGLEHTQVPGHDGKYGYGGACFPKDVAAFIHFAESIGVNLSLLKQTKARNEQIRNR